MERLERLVNLAAALLDAQQPLSREDVRVRVGGYSDDTESFRRNFERDKELLRQMGMPLVLEPLDARRPDGPAGYRIPRERYRLPDPGLADDELAALHLAASAVDVEGAWGRSAATGALWKLAAAAGSPNGVPQQGSDGTRTAPPPPAVPPPDGPGSPPPATAGCAPSHVALPAGEEVATIFGAVAARQRVGFRYHGGSRVVDPWRLSFRSGQWYLVGWDNSRNGSRTFRVDRIEGAPEPIGEAGAFDRPPTGSTTPPPPWQLGDDEEVTAVLRVDAEQAGWAIGAAGAGSRAEMGDDGSVVLSVTVTNRGAFRTFVLGFLDHAQLLGPPALVDDLIEWLERLATPSAQARRRGSTTAASRKPAAARPAAGSAAASSKRAAASSGPPPVTLPVAAKSKRRHPGQAHSEHPGQAHSQDPGQAHSEDPGEGPGQDPGGVHGEQRGEHPGGARGEEPGEQASHSPGPPTTA